MLWLGERISIAHACAHHPASGWTEDQRRRLYALNAAGLVSAGEVDMAEFVQLMLDTGVVELQDVYVRHNALREAVVARVEVLRRLLEESQL
ncbi:uncharacterized protein LOC62_01G000134 [Vanrija pseudolonga]|uniref:Uncharacterized protein n=1 Tax=Vanrija pseudolonga TaxID=143232 RepID=A0AAF0Y243_9TREE|nr:hypothetical protein LOC62_01G000134 [Vanrija pseudolonga]